MPFNGSGAYSLPVNSWNPAVAATTINPTDWNSTGTDLETALSSVITKDGQTTTTARIPFASGIQTDSITEITSTNGVTIAKVNAALGSDIPSPAGGTLNLTTATGQTVDVTGTNAITAITLGEGSLRWVRFTGILTLTNGASLVLPGAANITTAAGDYALFIGYAAGVVRCSYYQRAASVGGVESVTAADASITIAGTATNPTVSRAALTGDATASAGSNALTLATVNSNVGSFTAANITVNAKGLVTAAASGSAATNDQVLIQNQQTSGTTGQAYTASSWNKATLNTEVIDTASIASIASSVVTLAAGSYDVWAEVSWKAAAGGARAARLRLQDTTNTATIVQGENTSAPAAGGMVSSLMGSFTIAGSTNFELQLYPSSAGNLDAMDAITTGASEIYATIKFRRYAT